MSYYISTNSILQSYEELTKTETNNASILHIFFILKGCGYNSITYEPVDLISKNGFGYAFAISSLFSPLEQLPDKYDFINPFSMKTWSAQDPSESLSKWVGGRIKNNVIGGATTWRRLIVFDATQGTIKLSHNYIEILKELTVGSNSIDLPALAIWNHRFTTFDQETTLRMLVDNFISTFNISKHEEQLMFSHNSKISLFFSDKMHNASSIRKTIGFPSEQSNSWIEAATNTHENIDLTTHLIRRTSTMAKNTEHFTAERIKDLLDSHFQLILNGPPGTSKSYLADLVAEKFFKGKTTKIQFHPQFSYQDFIGGYIVNKTEVEYRKGVLLNLLESMAKNPDEPHLLVIDEINRANVSQVFGETIQCLDRNFSAEILVEGALQEFSLPKNLYIVGTMNTSDRTIGSIDFAIRRRFLNLYCPPDPGALIDLCPPQDDVSPCDLLRRINDKLFHVLGNKELVIGHSFFFSQNVKGTDGKYSWVMTELEVLFNYKILPLIENYCHGNHEQLSEILGEDLPQRCTGDAFSSAIKAFLS